MNQQHSTTSYLRNMEGDIDDIAGWSEVLHQLGSSPHPIDPSVVRVIAGPLLEIGERLNANWKSAFTAAGGQA